MTYEKIGTIQRRLAWPLHKDDTLFRSGRPKGLNIYFPIAFYFVLTNKTDIYIGLESISSPSTITISKYGVILYERSGFDGVCVRARQLLSHKDGGGQSSFKV